MRVKTMFKRLKAAARNEQGDYMIMFAALMSVIFMFVGMTVDFCQVYTKRLHLEEVGQILREVRFEEQPVYCESTNPQESLQAILRRYAVMNGLEEDQVTVTITETYQYGRSRAGSKKPCTNRTGDVTITLTDSYDCVFLSLFGIDTIEIKPVVIGGNYFMANSGGTWYPALGD